MPIVYFDRAPIFADPDPQRLRAQIELVVQMALDATRYPTYLLQACSIDEHQGFYTRDVFSRSAFRRRLQREGVRFADGPSCRFHEGIFQATDWGALNPKFIIEAGGLEDPEEVIESTPGIRAFTLASRRMGMPKRDEMTAATANGRGLLGIASGDAGAIVRALRARLQT